MNLRKPSYDYQNIEKKWAKKWQDSHLYEVDIQNAKKPFYNLWMFPYPSGAKMHVGHAFASTGSDIIGRYKRMQGYDVFQPMGFDAFGIHGENYAIKVNEHPWHLMEKLSDEFRDTQFKRIGHGIDWSKELRTYWPSYYKWTQWIFIKLYENGLAEQKKAKVNWCPSCKTVLADEQVIGGECERCGTQVEKRELEQWFFKITKFADKLLKNLNHIDWSKRIVEAQRNWIGKKEGIEITYDVVRNSKPGVSDESENSPQGEEKIGKVVCFTTRPDTNFGATFVVLAPEHDLVKKILSGEIKVYDEDSKNSELIEQIKKYVTEAINKSDVERLAEGKKKTGAFTGLYAVNQLTGYRMPLWISDFVLGDYGTGAVVGVPAHDTRDFEFAKEFGLEIIRVVKSADDSDGGSADDDGEITDISQVQEDEGVMINSGFLNGMNIQDAIEKMKDYLEEKGWGKRVVTFRLRDWSISRQRYWGAPIPVVYCDKCGTVPVPEEDLPVELPFVDEWKPSGDGKGPLANIPEFVNTTCPKCGAPAKRETDTFDNFLDSAWYFFRYPFVNREDVPFATPSLEKSDDSEPNSEAFKKWLPVTLYLGGPEHAVLHLMYTRFITMAFEEIGLIDFDEPFERFVAHGHITMGGKKMSKSLGNIVIPDDYMNEIGADALRMYLMFLGPLESAGDFNDDGISGITKFLDRVWNLMHDSAKSQSDKSSEKVLKKLHKTIKGVSEDIENFKYNTAISKLMELVNVWNEKSESLTLVDSVKFLKLLAPFAPFITEEIYQEIVVEAGNYDVVEKDCLSRRNVKQKDASEKVLQSNELVSSSSLNSAKLSSSLDSPNSLNSSDTSDSSKSLTSNDVLDDGNNNVTDTTENVSTEFISIHVQCWPEYDKSLIAENFMSIPVQINGKVKRVLKNIPVDIEEEDLKSLALKEVQDLIVGKDVVKVIYVKDRLISVVVR